MLLFPNLALFIALFLIDFMSNIYKHDIFSSSNVLFEDSFVTAGSKLVSIDHRYLEVIHNSQPSLLFDSQASKLYWYSIKLRLLKVSFVVPSWYEYFLTPLIPDTLSFYPTRSIRNL